MKKAIFLFVVLVAAQIVAQEKFTLTVKSTEVSSNGVVIVTGQRTPLAMGAALTEPTKKTVELQCNKGMTGCTTLKADSYVMVKLPPNHGMYECVDVLVYAPGVDPDKGTRIGEYCLTEK